MFEFVDRLFHTNICSLFSSRLYRDFSSLFIYEKSFHSVIYVFLRSLAINSNRIERTMPGKRHDRCLVCDDVAIGINFGVPTCMPCKAFFRRNAVRLGVSIRFV